MKKIILAILFSLCVYTNGFTQPKDLSQDIVTPTGQFSPHTLQDLFNKSCNVYTILTPNNPLVIPNTALMVFLENATTGSPLIIPATQLHTHTAFNSSDEPSAYAGYESSEFMAASFHLVGVADLQIQLSLSSNTPNDGKSIDIYLVGDDGTGGAVGKAGNPNLITNPTTHAVIGFNSASSIYITTIQDSSLSAFNIGPTTITINIPATAVAKLNTMFNATNGEYWIGISTGSTADGWWYNGNGTGVNVANQKYYNNTVITNTVATSLTTGQAQMMSVVEDYGNSIPITVGGGSTPNSIGIGAATLSGGTGDVTICFW